MSQINKKDLIRLLEKIATYMELKGENPFRIAAYRKAAQGLEQDVRSLNEIQDFTTIPGIGKGTNELIQEFIETGTSETLKSLEAEIPAGLVPLLKLPGLGGKRLAVLYKELDVIDAESLKNACLEGKVEKVKGFGKKSAENIAEALNNQLKRPERLPVAYMLELAYVVEEYLQTIPEIKQFSLAGSLRRMKETIKDIDFIIATDDYEKVREAIMKMEFIKEVIASGDTKVSVTLDEQYGVNVDFRLVSEEEFYTTLHHFTGSKEHNVKMRQLAKSRGEKINEYGVEVEETGEILHFNSEKEFFKHFGVRYIPPEMREDKGEIETFINNDVELLEREQIRGDLHMHTIGSDGKRAR
ncbi:DNA polymerase/3'-5' exonuclease PolX [Pseudogracilibacillus sp. SE30717A]|uniref:DNA polymerase/3'-5' exonuclease PolX n=1 Tax=Pseudogracilibacillus sp. SE30717A TaxID=3098293 RepID=UPI00300DFCCC